MARFFDPKCTQDLLPKVTNLTANSILPLSSWKPQTSMI